MFGFFMFHTLHSIEENNSISSPFSLSTLCGRIFSWLADFCSWKEDIRNVKVVSVVSNDFCLMENSFLCVFFTFVGQSIVYVTSWQRCNFCDILIKLDHKLTHNSDSYYCILWRLIHVCRQIHTNSLYLSLETTVLPKSMDPYTTDCSCSRSKMPEEKYNISKLKYTLMICSNFRFYKTKGDMRSSTLCPVQ